jgi:hypothetical protein
MKFGIESDAAALLLVVGLTLLAFVLLVGALVLPALWH